MENLIKGRQPVLEALRADLPLETLFMVFGGRGSGIQEIRQLARRRGIPVKEIDRKRFQQICPDENAQGVVAIAGAKQYVEIEDLLRVAEGKGEKPFLLILDEIEDPHNLGALIRTGECAGVHGVIVPRHHSASLNETVAKTSAGASLHMPASRVTNLATTLEELRTRGIWIVGTDMLAARSYDDIDYRDPVAIVIGNEGRGIRRLVKEKCDFLVKIPLFGKIGSLNASVAGGLVLFEVVRSRHSRSEGTSGEKDRVKV